MGPGPDDTVLMQFGRNERSIVLAVGDRDGERAITLKRKDLGAVHANELFSGFFWAKGSARLYTVGWALASLDVADVLSRKPTRLKAK